MASLFDMKQELADRQQAAAQNQPQVVQREQMPFDPNAPTLGGRTEVALTGGMTEHAVSGMEKAKMDQLKAGVRGEFEKLLMQQERGVDKFVQSATMKYGEGVREYLPPKELFYDNNGDFQPVEYYKHALVGIKEYRPVLAKQRESEKAATAFKAWSDAKGGATADEWLGFQAGGLTGTLDQYNKRTETEAQQRKDEARLELDTRRLNADIYNQDVTRAIEKAKVMLKEKEYLNISQDQVDDVQTEIKNVNDNLLKLEVEIGKYGDKKTPTNLTSYRKTLMDNLAKLKDYKDVLQKHVNQIPKGEQSEIKKVTEAQSDFDAKVGSAASLVEKDKQGGYRGFNLWPTTWGTADDRKRRDEEFKETHPDLKMTTEGGKYKITGFGERPADYEPPTRSQSTSTGNAYSGRPTPSSSTEASQSTEKAPTDETTTTQPSTQTQPTGGKKIPLTEVHKMIQEYKNKGNVSDDVAAAAVDAFLKENNISY